MSAYFVYTMPMYPALVVKEPSPGQQAPFPMPLAQQQEYINDPADIVRIKAMLAAGEIKGNSLVPIKYGNATKWVNMINVASIYFD